MESVNDYARYSQKITKSDPEPNLAITYVGEELFQVFSLNVSRWIYRIYIHVKYFSSLGVSHWDNWHI